MGELIQIFLSWGWLGLALVSFTEASFFIIPPDVLLIPLAIANPEKAIWYALITTLASILGAFLGHYFGIKFGRPFLRRFANETTINRVEEMFDSHGTWAITVAGFTPIPYKVFTIAGGVFRISRLSLLSGSVVGRGLRFFSEAAVIILLGQQAKSFIDQYAGLGTIGIAVLLTIIYIIIKKLSSE